MDINDFRTVATVLVFLAFVGIVWWAYGPSRKKYFDQASQLPFQDKKPDLKNAEKENTETDAADTAQADNNSSDDQKNEGDQA